MSVSATCLRSGALGLCLFLLAVSTAACRSAKPREAPPIVGSAALGKPPFIGGHRPLLAPDGRLVVLEADAVVAIDAGGKPRWQRPFEHGDWIVPLADGSLFVTDGAKRELVALDPATGADRWRVPIPIAAGADASDDRHARGAVRVPAGVVVALADARFLHVDPAQCAANGPSCLTLRFSLHDESLSDITLDALPNDDLLLAESGLIRQLSRTGETRAAFHVRDGQGQVALAGGRLAVAMDTDLVLFDLSRCAAKKTVVLPRKPNQLYIRGEGECDDCIPPPSGCLVARPRLGDVDAVAPLVMADGGAVLTHDDGIVRVSSDGKTSWKSDIAAFGRVIEMGQDLVAVASNVGDRLGPSPARVVALDPATGKLRWSRDLPVTTGAIVSTDEAILAANGEWLVAGYKTSVSWIRITSR